MIIYRIKNLINGKIYIGQTTLTLFNKENNEKLKFSYYGVSDV